MKEHFSDDQFTDAGKVYQSIKAPSELRERVLTAAQAESGKADRSDRMKPAARMGAKGRILQLASVAACLAVMVVALPDWQQNAPIGNAGAARMISMEEPADMSGQEAYSPEEDGSMTDNPQVYLESQIPAIFGPDADLTAMEIHMVSQSDTLCTAEVSMENSITMEIVLEKNTDTDFWEVTVVREKEE